MWFSWFISGKSCPASVNAARRRGPVSEEVAWPARWSTSLYPVWRRPSGLWLRRKPSSLGVRRRLFVFPSTSSLPVASGLRHSGHLATLVHGRELPGNQNMRVEWMTARTRSQYCPPGAARRAFPTHPLELERQLPRLCRERAARQENRHSRQVRRGSSTRNWFFMENNVTAVLFPRLFDVTFIVVLHDVRNNESAEWVVLYGMPF